MTAHRRAIQTVVAVRRFVVEVRPLVIALEISSYPYDGLSSRYPDRRRSTTARRRGTTARRRPGQSVFAVRRLVVALDNPSYPYDGSSSRYPVRRRGTTLRHGGTTARRRAGQTVVPVRRLVVALSRPSSQYDRSRRVPLERRAEDCHPTPPFSRRSEMPSKREDQERRDSRRRSVQYPGGDRGLPREPQGS